MAIRGRVADDAAEAWLKHASEVDAASWGNWSTAEGLRRLLAIYHSLMNGCPSNILQLFDQFDEADLKTEARNLMSFPPQREKVQLIDQAEDALRKLARILRMLDERLGEQAEGAVLDPEAEWAVDECDCFVVPVAHFGINQDRARTGQSFGRRGILRHRVLSRKVTGVTIHLTVHPDFASAAERKDVPPMTFGAAVFPDFDFKYDERPENRFLMTEVSCGDGIHANVALQVGAFREAGCDIAVWPELTIDTDARVHLSGLLQPTSDPRPHPAVVVAGSWHVEADDKHFNESVVYDGRGEPILFFDKMRIFRFKGRAEDIQAGTSVEILIWDNKLLAFAICKDFCDRAKDVPIVGLDVDLAIVPSMGGSSTLDAHGAAASDMKIRFGTRTFVVQQSVPMADLAAGYVMALPDEPLKEPRKSMETEGEFTTFQLMREKVIQAGARKAL